MTYMTFIAAMTNWQHVIALLALLLLLQVYHLQAAPCSGKGGGKDGGGIGGSGVQPNCTFNGTCSWTDLVNMSTRRSARTVLQDTYE
jgi:hypothetical protein